MRLEQERTHGSIFPRQLLGHKLRKKLKAKMDVCPEWLSKNLEVFPKKRFPMLLQFFLSEETTVTNAEVRVSREE